MYYFPLDPPYFLLVIGLFFGITSGLAFQASLKEKVQKWSKSPANNPLNKVRNELKLPFWGITIGIALFLKAGLEVFGFPASLANAIALPLTALTTWLVWSQLNTLFLQLERGGSKAIDLDTW